MLPSIKKSLFIPGIVISIGIMAVAGNLPVDSTNAVQYFPRNNAERINPDAPLRITFQSAPILGDSGQIRVYDSEDGRLADVLDLSIPPGPTATTPSPEAIYTPVPYKYVSEKFTNANTKAGTPSGEAVPTSDAYQLNIIGGFTDAFHFYPVIVHENTATIYLHNNLLEYGRTYYVQIDPGVLTLSDGSFNGITGKKNWRFSTKKNPPSADSDKLIVSADGTGDFNTVQGALDSIPDYDQDRKTIFLKDGMYEEIVYFRNKTNVTIVGEDRDNVIVLYENNEIFNPHPLNIKTNEVPGTFPSRRAVFAADNSKGIRLVNFTVKNTSYGQAEGLLLNGSEFIVSNVNIIGSGDALQSNGSAYFDNCRIGGATSSSLVLDHVESSDEGTYAIRVQNRSGSITSKNAILNVEESAIPGP